MRVHSWKVCQAGQAPLMIAKAHHLLEQPDLDVITVDQNLHGHILHSILDAFVHLQHSAMVSACSDVR